jgi:predicted lipoprotein with Yx(FWY)xxD motif
MLKRFGLATASAAAAVLLAACGSSGYNVGSQGSTAAAGAAGTVAVRQVSGVGNVLVDSKGLALYSPDQEASGKVLCTGSCVAFWMPLPAGTAAPATVSGVGMLGTVTRPDGTKQVTVDGKPLYTFAEDSPGNVKGNGFSDAFGGQHFTWHAILASGTAAVATGSSVPGTTPAGSGYGYGY